MLRPLLKKKKSWVVFGIKNKKKKKEKRGVPLIKTLTRKLSKELSLSASSLLKHKTLAEQSR